MHKVITLAAIVVVAVAAVSAPPLRPVYAQVPSNPQPGGQIPSLPDPVPVSLDSSTTAFLALDIISTLCTPSGRPTCVPAIPAITAGVSSARAAGAAIIYTTFGSAAVIPEMAPAADDAVVASTGPDKFLNSNLDDILKRRGITTVVIAGWAMNGAVIYTGFEAAARGYTVVVAVDASPAPTDFDSFAAEWQLLNGFGTTNPQNTPLQPKAATLSRTDLITYK